LSKTKYLIMKKHTRLAILLLGFPLVFLTSCGGDNDNKDADAISDEPVSEQVEEPQGNKTYYQIPSPDEMFGFIKESGLTYNVELLNNIDKANSYTDPKRQALNFGIYSADLAYAAAYQEFNTAIKYFGTIQKLADNVGIAGAFDKELIQKIQANLNNPDSLLENSSASYFSVVDYLIQNEQGDKLGIIAAAGWLETVYIVVNTANYNKDKKAIDRLADQKLILENLLDYLKEYSSNDGVAAIQENLKDLKSLFDGLDEKEGKSGVALKKNKGGKMVLGGGNSIVMTEVQFNAIKDKVNEIRNNIVKINE